MKSKQMNAEAVPAKVNGERVLGFLAIDQYGEDIRLLEPENPRKQLLEKLGRQHADKMYCDLKAGGARHTGYIVAGRWFTLYTVCAWNGGKA